MVRVEARRARIPTQAGLGDNFTLVRLLFFTLTSVYGEIKNELFPRFSSQFFIIFVNLKVPSRSSRKTDENEELTFHVTLLFSSTRTFLAN